MINKGTAYILWLLGLHRFYLGHPIIGFIQPITFGGFFVWWIVDGIRMGQLVKKANDKYYYERSTS